MNYIKTEVYAGYNLSMKFPSRCKEVSIQRSRSREMRLQGRIKLENGCDKRSLIFALQSRFKLKKIDEDKIRVPTGCILSVGTVPTGCILFVVTVPTGYILLVGTVPTGCILSVGTVPMRCILIQLQRFMLSGLYLSSFFSVF